MGVDTDAQRSSVTVPGPHQGPGQSWNRNRAWVPQAVQQLSPPWDVGLPMVRGWGCEKGRVEFWTPFPVAREADPAQGLPKVLCHLLRT